MTAKDLLAALRERGVELLGKSGRLVARPASKLTAAEYAALREHSAELLTLLRAPKELEVDRLMRAERETEDRLLAALAAPRTVALFRTRRGVMELRDLSPQEARDLERRGKLSAEEAREWARTRRSGWW